MMAAVAALFAFASCGGDPVEETPAKLSAPTISIKNVTTNGFTVSWKAVTGAKSYSVVLNSEKPVSTSETSYEFANLAPGTYKVKVKAVAGTTQSPFSKEQTVNIEGATDADWFTLSLTALTESEELSNGQVVNPWDALKVSMKGTGVAEMTYALFYTEEIANKSNVELMEMLEEVADQDLIDAINSAEGTGFTYYGITGSTSCTFVAYVKNTNNEAALIKDSATTAETQLSENAKAWIGTWTGNTEETMTWVFPTDLENGYLTFEAGTANNDVELKIVPIEGYSDVVFVYGLSVLGDEYEVVGYVAAGATSDGVFHNQLQIVGMYDYPGESADALTWIPFSKLYDISGYEDGYISMVGGEYATYIFDKTDAGVTAGTYYGELDGGGAFEVFSVDVCWYNAQNRGLGLVGIYELDENGEPVLDENGDPIVNSIDTWKAGEIKNFTQTSTENPALTPSALSKSAKSIAKTKMYNSLVIE